MNLEQQRENLLQRVQTWEREAEEALREAGRLLPARANSREDDSANARRREVLLGEAARLNECAADVRFVLDAPRSFAGLSDPLYS